MPIVVDIDVMLAKRKMPVGTLAERVGITPANLAVLKNGRAKAVRFTTLAALCEVLRASPATCCAGSPRTRRTCSHLTTVTCRTLRERDQVQVVLVPEVLDAVGQQHNALGIQCLDGTFVVADQNDGTGVVPQRPEDFGAAGRVQVVGGLIQQEHVGAGRHDGGKRQAGLLTAGENPGRLVDVVPGEQERAEDSADLRVLHVRRRRAHVLQHGPVDVQRLVFLGVVARLLGRGRR